MGHVSTFLLASLFAGSAVAASTVDIHIKQNNRPTIPDAYASATVDLTIEVINRTTEPVEVRRIVVAPPWKFLSRSERREAQRDPARLVAANQGFSFERQALLEKRTIAPGRSEEFRVLPEVTFGFTSIGDVRVDVTVVTPSGWEVVSVVQPMRLRVDRAVTVRTH
jgi:hypothetical protein